MRPSTSSFFACLQMRASPLVPTTKLLVAGLPEIEFKNLFLYHPFLLGLICAFLGCGYFPWHNRIKTTFLKTCFLLLLLLLRLRRIHNNPSFILFRYCKVRLYCGVFNALPPYYFAFCLIPQFSSLFSQQSFPPLFYSLLSPITSLPLKSHIKITCAISFGRMRQQISCTQYINDVSSTVCRIPSVGVGVSKSTDITAPKIILTHTVHKILFILRSDICFCRSSV